MRLGEDRPARPLVHVAIAGQRHDQQIAVAPRLFQVPHMPHMQQVEDAMRVHDATAGGTRRLRHLTQFLNATDLVASPDRGTLRPGLVLRQLHVHHLFYARRYTHTTGAAWPAIC